MRSVNMVALTFVIFLSQFSVAQDYSGKQTQEWSEVQTKLSALKGKVDNQDAIVKNLIIEKSALTGEQQAAKIEELKKEHQRWQALVADYNKLDAEYETKFPEKGIKESRVYKRISVKSIERIENDMTLEGRLVRLQKKVLNQYPKTARQIEQKKEKKRKLEEEKRVSRSHLAEKNKTLNVPILTESGDVTESIILKK